MAFETERGAERRSKHDRRHDDSSRRASRTLIALVAAILLPTIVMVILAAKSTGPDLSDLTPTVSQTDRYVMIGWSELERGRNALSAGGISSGAMVRILGYMMDSGRPIRDGEPVQRFVLLPDAGNPLHPAHRFGDQMIDVRIGGGNRVSFSERSLVWVWGTLRMLSGDTSGHEPLYVLEDAHTNPADTADIQKYYK